MPAEPDGCGEDLRSLKHLRSKAGQELSATLGSVVLNCYSVRAGQALGVAVGFCPECWRIVVSGDSKSTLKSALNSWEDLNKSLSSFRHS